MRAKRSLGQNFLQDDDVIKQIVDSLDLFEGDTVVEIGPGRGALTEKLVEAEVNVLAFEIDRQLVPALQSQFRQHFNFEIVEADVLEIVIADHLIGIKPGNTKAVGNLPYYISTAILQKLAVERALFSRIVLMLQREVVERITAEPGNSDRGYLTVLTEASFQTEKLFDVSPSAFSPRPKVWSSVIRLIPNKLSLADEEDFRRFLGIAFAQKRKTLANNLKSLSQNAAYEIESCAIDPKRRAETLTLFEWEALYRTFSSKKRPLVDKNERP